MPDAHKNFAYSLVATAPSPATSGTSLVVSAGTGARFPAVPFNATIWPVGAVPTPLNAEIVRVTAIATDTLTVTRAQESSTARTVVVGDQIAATITVKTLTDVEASEVTITSTGTQDAVALGTTGPVVLRCNNATLLTLRGIVAGAPGQRLTIQSVGAGQVDLLHQHATPSAANRLINMATGGATSLAAGSGSAIYSYDATAGRWRLGAHEQGAYISVPLVGADFTTNNGVTWTIYAGSYDLKYMLRGSQMHVLAGLDWDLSANTATQLQIKIPGGFTARTTGSDLAFMKDATVKIVSRVSANDTGTNINIARLDQGVLSGSGGAPTYYGQNHVNITFGVY